jgi:hypothetical protein
MLLVLGVALAGCDRPTNHERAGPIPTVADRPVAHAVVLQVDDMT